MLPFSSLLFSFFLSSTAEINLPKFKTSFSVTSMFYPESCHAETPFQQGPFLICIYLYRWAPTCCQQLIPWTVLHCTQLGKLYQRRRQPYLSLKAKKNDRIVFEILLMGCFHFHSSRADSTNIDHLVYVNFISPICSSLNREVRLQLNSNLNRSIHQASKLEMSFW